VTKSLNIEVVYQYRTTGASETKPLWLDIDGCGDSEYSIGAGYSDTTADWTSNVSGRVIAINGHLHDVDITNATPCDTHCAAQGGGIAVSAELVGGSNTYYGPVPPNNPPPADLTGTTICRSEGYYGTPWAGTNFKGHLDTMSTCGIGTDRPGTAQPEAYPAGGNYPTTGVPFAAGQTIKLHSEYQNDTGSPQTDVMGIMMAWYAPTNAATTGYPRPKGASPFRASLVPAFQQCTSPNRTHGTPLNSPSCAAPNQASGQLTIGSPDANGAAANSISSVTYLVVAGNSGTVADEADVKVKVSAIDVRKKSDLTDYAGQLKGTTSMRVTDRDNGPSELGTTQSLPLSFTVPCTTTPASSTIGSSCTLDTTADAVVPNTVKEGRRSVWEMDKVQLFDGGTDGVAGTDPNTLFLTQGYFVP
jgi:hypothetical protein